MFTRLRQMLLLHARLCAGCERYKATQGLLCVYCHLDARLDAAFTHPGDEPINGLPVSNIRRHPTDTPVQDYTSLLPPYIN